jgi:hypothetical protein
MQDQLPQEKHGLGHDESTGAEVDARTDDRLIILWNAVVSETLQVAELP